MMSALKNSFLFMWSFLSYLGIAKRKRVGSIIGRSDRFFHAVEGCKQPLLKLQKRMGTDVWHAATKQLII